MDTAGSKQILETPSMIINPYRFASGAFSPTDIANLEVWFDCSDSDTIFDSDTGGSLPADDGDVGRIEDKSGNDNHARQATASLRPHRRVSEINSLDTVDFNGSSEYFSLDSTITFPAYYTSFIVLERSTTAIFNSALGGSDYRGHPFLWNTSNTWYCASVNDEMTRSTANPTDTGTILCMNSYDDDTDTHVFRKDGSSLSVGSSSGGTTVDIIYLGRRRSNYNNGNICECLLYTAVLSSEDRGSVETYLADKWGITLP